MTPVTSSSLVPTSTSNESHTRSDELRARSRYEVQRVSHLCRRASRSLQIRNSRSRSTEDRQPPCSASTTTRNKEKELNGAPLPCLPCFCSVSCAQGMTFCSTLKGCGSHIIKCVHSVKLNAMCNVQVWRVDGQAQTQNVICNRTQLTPPRIYLHHGLNQSMRKRHPHKLRLLRF